jgi:Ser/Thr protein kinase RdoA (MazF antagonist)
MQSFAGTVPLPMLERAVRRALPAWSLAPSMQVALLNVSENATFLLADAAADRRLALRVHRPGYHTEAEIRSELAWIGALRAEAAIAAPAPLAGTNGEPVQWVRLSNECDSCIAALPAVAFEYVAGIAPEQSGNLAPIFRALGVIAARLHRHARGWARPPGFRRKTWDFASTLGERPLWGDWRAGPGLHRAGLALLERVARVLRARLAAFGTEPHRFGLIHADLRLANLLADGERLTVIDFDDCGFGWFAYDFAAAVSFFEDDPVIPVLLAAWLDGYRTVAPFEPAAEAEIPAFVMLRRLLLLAWIGSHSEASAAVALRDRYANGTLTLAEAFLRRYG